MPSQGDAIEALNALFAELHQLGSATQTYASAEELRRWRENAVRVLASRVSQKEARDLERMARPPSDITEPGSSFQEELSQYGGFIAALRNAVSNGTVVVDAAPLTSGTSRPKRHAYGGRWEVAKAFGEGGQAHTFLVRDILSDDPQTFVLKRLKNQNRVGRFVAEIEAARTISHPNVLRVVDFDHASDRPFLVSEHCERGSLKHSGLAGHLPVLDALGLFTKICAGVEAAHLRRIIHRDLKPDNIFLRGDGEPVVGDFGICLIEGGERHTAVDEVVGARNFTAPELEDGRVECVSPQADVYSLGKLLYWLVSGRSLARERHRDQGLDLRAPGQPPEVWFLYEVLDGAIASEPSDRFQDAGKLREAVDLQIQRIQRGGHVINKSAPQPCSYCAAGTYRLVVDRDNVATRNFGLEPRGSANYMILVCGTCGHVQLFRPDLAVAQWDRG